MYTMFKHVASYTSALGQEFHMRRNERQNENLSFRPFRKGFDEPIWVDIANAVYADDPDWGGATVDGMIEGEKSPDFQSEGRFIVELGAKPVGVINAHAAKPREDKKGFVYVFGALPSLKEKGVEEDMARFTINNLKSRGMGSVNFWIYERRMSLRRILERLDFETVRALSFMEIDLAKKQLEPGSSHIELRSLDMENDKEIEELTWLENECFKEEYNYCPRTAKEMRYAVLKDPYLKEQACFFAIEGSQKIGYIRLGIDEQYNKEKKARAGFIPAFGVLQQHRRKGVGTQLMLKALETLREKGMQKAQLGVDDLNPAMAKKFYETIGFRTISSYLAYVKKL
jgi:ribosomal protein S18 acetylase RimI-like enzyme